VAAPFVTALLFASALAPAPCAACMPAGAAPVAALVQPTNAMVSPLALLSGGITGFGEPEEKKPGKASKKPKHPADAQGNEGLGPERARILLQSLTVPGWGQATLGHYGSAKAFLAVEAGIWVAFASFHIQEAQRTDSYLLTARLNAGINLHGYDDEFRRIVGSFASSDEYNLLVVSRDAANLYLSTPGQEDLVAYRAYIAAHSLSGAMTWHWSDEEAFRRYSDQRQSSQKAGLRANTALGLAIANRLVSALHAAHLAGHKAAAQQQGWRLDVLPGPDEPGQIRAALSTQF
jgi:hypothetical protein